MGGFRHEALLYADEGEFLEGTATFVEAALARDEPVLVVLGADKIRLLRSALDGASERVRFADMAEVGANPARILPAWQEFVSEAAATGRSGWGIGEPIWPAREPPELVECQLHESLLNVALAHADGFRLMCPYDTAALDAAVIEEACCSHRVVIDRDGERESAGFRGRDGSAAQFLAPLPKPPGDHEELRFDRASLPALRRFVALQAQEAGLDGDRGEDLMIAVNEVATNSVRHGGGGGRLRVWRDGDRLVCEVSDRGRIDRLLVGREVPDPVQDGGHGLWMANQLSDLVQIRSSQAGTVVRVHMRNG